MLFFTLAKVIDHKCIQLNFREQPISDDFKLLLNGIHTDPFGQKHEKRKEDETDEVSKFALSSILSFDETDPFDPLILKHK